MLKLRKLFVAGVAAVAVLGGGLTAAHAGTSYTGYNTTVGKFNGNGYSGTQTKSATDRSGDLRSTSVGGNYKVDARMEGVNVGVPGTPWVRVDDNVTRKLSNVIHRGNKVRVRFSNDAGTRVDVQVRGSWRSN